eukprot:1265613-Amphidinium_carterae.1
MSEYEPSAVSTEGSLRADIHQMQSIHVIGLLLPPRAALASTLSCISAAHAYAAARHPSIVA